MRLRRPARGSDRGYSIVEAVITLPVIVTLVMLVVQYALLWHARHLAQAAAEEGLRVGRGYQASASAGQREALSYLHALAPRLLEQPRVELTRDAATLTVRVHARVLSIVPIGALREVEESASGPLERFVAAGSGG